jgi:hypothetical protein
LKVKKIKIVFFSSFQDNYDQKPMELEDMWNTTYIPITNEPTANTGEHEDMYNDNSSNDNDFACDVKSEPDLDLESYQFANASIVTSPKKRPRKRLRQNSIESNVVAGSSKVSPSKQTQSQVTPASKNQKPEIENFVGLRNASHNRESAVHSILERRRLQQQKTAATSITQQPSTSIAKQEVSIESGNQGNFKSLRDAVRNHSQLQSIIERRKQQASQLPMALPTIAAPESSAKTTRKENETQVLPIIVGVVSTKERSIAALPSESQTATTSIRSSATEKEENLTSSRAAPRNRQSLISSFLHKTPKAEIAEVPAIVVSAAVPERECFESLRTASRIRQSQVGDILERRRQQLLRIAEAVVTPAALATKTEIETTVSSLSALLKTEGVQPEQLVQQPAEETAADTSILAVQNHSQLQSIIERRKQQPEPVQPEQQVQPPVQETAAETSILQPELPVPQLEDEAVERLRRAAHSEILERQKKLLEVTVATQQSTSTKTEDVETVQQSSVGTSKLPEEGSLESLCAASRQKQPVLSVITGEETTTVAAIAITEPNPQPSQDEQNFAKLRLASHNNTQLSKLIMERRRQQQIQQESTQLLVVAEQQPLRRRQQQIQQESTQLLVVAEHQPLRRITIDSSQYASCDSLVSNLMSPTDDIGTTDEGEPNINDTDERTPTRPGPKSSKRPPSPDFIEMEVS